MTDEEREKALKHLREATPEPVSRRSHIETSCSMFWGWKLFENVVNKSSPATVALQEAVVIPSTGLPLRKR